MAKAKTPPKDAGVVTIAERFLDVAGALTDEPCPVCSAHTLHAEIIPHSGVRIYCVGLDETTSGDDVDRCTFARVRRFGQRTVTSPRAERANVLSIVPRQQEQSADEASATTVSLD